MWRVEVALKGGSLCGMSKAFVERVVKESILKSGVKNKHTLVFFVGVGGVTENAIQSLNKTYRGKDASTDVLSFSEYSDKVSIQAEHKKEINLGDVILSCEVIQRQAKEDGVSSSRELAYLLSHGVLHLLGYDHEPEMFSIQDEICDILNEEVSLKEEV